MPVNNRKPPTSVPSTVRASTPTATAPTAPTATPSPATATGHSSASGFDGTVSDALANALGQAIEANFGGGASDTPTTVFQGKTGKEIAQMSIDEIKSASASEIRSLTRSQLRGFLSNDGVLQGFGDMSKDQRKAVLRAQLKSDMFDEIVKSMQKYSRQA